MFFNKFLFIGLTDSMRDNFHLMNALAKHTRVAPKSRIDKLLTFNRRLRSVPAIVQELTDWNLKLDDRSTRQCTGSYFTGGGNCIWRR